MARAYRDPVIGCGSRGLGTWPIVPRSCHRWPIRWCYWIAEPCRISCWVYSGGCTKPTPMAKRLCS